MKAEKYLLILDAGVEQIALQYQDGEMTIYYRAPSYRLMRKALILFGWNTDQPDPPIAGEYKQRAMVRMERPKWETGIDSILAHIGTTAEIARVMRRLVSVKALGRVAW